MMINPRFVLGSLDLTLDPYSVEFGTELGEPANEVALISSALRDGDVVSTARRGNRTITLPVMLNGYTQQGLAEAERDLALEVAKPFNWLSIDPGDGTSVPTLFQVFEGEMSFRRDDDGEANIEPIRRYLLTFSALPHGFSATETTTTASTFVATPTTVVISDGTDTTGWSAEQQGTPQTVTSDAGRLKAVGTHIGGTTLVNGRPAYTFKSKFTRTFSPASSFTGTQYISAEVSTSRGLIQSAPILAINNNEQPAPVANEDLGGGVRRFTWQVTASLSSVSEVSFASQSLQYDSSPLSFFLDNVKRSNVPPTASSTGRESLRLLAVEGSARSTGSLEIGHETAALGETIVYTTPRLADGYDPRLRQYLNLTGVTTTTDSTTVTGLISSRSSGSFVFDIPAAILPPGPFLLMARARFPGGGATLSGAAQTVIGSVTFPGASFSGPAAGLTGAFSILRLGVVTMPNRNVSAQSTAIVRITLGPALTELDQLWAFSLSEGASLTHIDCGAGTPANGFAHNRLFLDAPSVENQGRRELLVGTQADRSDAFDNSSAALAWDDHVVEPPTQMLHVITVGAPDPTVTWRSRAAWHTNAAS